MSNSPLVVYTRISPHRTSPRNHKIDKITIHHMAGNLTIEGCGSVFQTRKASSNYGIGSDGRVGMYVEEADRSWASSNKPNDHRAVTIEVANCGGDPNWPVSDKALATLIELCVDICRRNDIPKLNFTGDKTGNLTMHCYFAATACPGPYLKSKFQYIADEVNKRLAGEETAPEQETEPETQQLKVDGIWGEATTRRLQQIFGTTVDGKVSNQLAMYRSTNPGLTTGWDWDAKPNGKGSQLIRAMQSWAGMPDSDRDGEIGPKTIRAIQKKLGTPQDGVVSKPSQMVKALQKWANGK